MPPAPQTVNITLVTTMPAESRHGDETIEYGKDERGDYYNRQVGGAWLWLCTGAAWPAFACRPGMVAADH